MKTPWLILPLASLLAAAPGPGLAASPSEPATSAAGQSTDPHELAAYLGVLACSVEPALADSLPLEDDERGVLLTSIDPQGPAAAAGLRQADILVDLAGQHPDSPLALQRLLQDHQPGQEVALQIIRQGQREDLFCTLGQRRIEPEKLADLPVGGGHLDASLLQRLEALGARRDRNPATAQLDRLQPLLRALEDELNGVDHPGVQEALDLLAENGEVQLMGRATTVIEVADDDGRVRLVEEDDRPTVAEVYDAGGELAYRGEIDPEGSLDRVPPAHRERVRAALNACGSAPRSPLGGLLELRSSR